MIKRLLLKLHLLWLFWQELSSAVNAADRGIALRLGRATTINGFMYDMSIRTVEVEPFDLTCDTCGLPERAPFWYGDSCPRCSGKLK